MFVYGAYMLFMSRFLAIHTILGLGRFETVVHIYQNYRKSCGKMEVLQMFQEGAEREKEHGRENEGEKLGTA